MMRINAPTQPAYFCPIVHLITPVGKLGFIFAKALPSKFSMCPNPAPVTNHRHGITLVWWRVPGPPAAHHADSMRDDDVASVATVDAHATGVIGFHRPLQFANLGLPKFLSHRGKMLAHELR